MDRHIAAFLMERDAKIIESSLYNLDQGSESMKMMAVLSVYASIQRKYKLGKLPNLTKAFGRSMSVCYEMFRDKNYRKILAERVKSEMQKGSLMALLNLISDNFALEKDKAEYKAAKAEYLTLEAERLEIKEKLLDRDAYTAQEGRRLAAIVAGTFAALATLMVMLIFLLRTGGGSGI